jgi:tripartite-type tricarboxylate transporter receptor subunit TctC
MAFARGAWVACAFALSTAVAYAQTYPNRPIQLVVPAAAGGSTDLFARKFAQQLEKQLGQPVVILDKGGGGGSIASGDVAKAKPDGYTLLMSTTGNAVINPLTMQLNFDPNKELTPIAVLGFVPFCIAINPSLSAANVEQFISVVKAAPGKYSYATNGPAGFIHMITVLFSKEAGLDMVAVPYPGGTAMQQDLIAGRVPIYFDALNSALRFHKTGQTRVIATTGGHRSSIAPDIPTVAESGLPGYVAETAFILMAPTGTPPAVVDRLVIASQKAMTDEALRKDLEEMAVRAVSDSNPKAAAEYIRTEFEKWTPVVKSLKAAT